MPFNPNDKNQLKRLKTAIQFSRKEGDVFRENQKQAVRQLVGSHYSAGGSKANVPVNYIELAYNIYSRLLAPDNPRALVTTDFRELKPSAVELELATNHLLEEIKFNRTLRLVVQNALMGMGIVKQGLASQAKGEVDGFLHDVGQPYVDVVNLDDWVQDMSATKWEQIGYCGNRYRLPLEEAMEIEAFNKQEREQLKGTRMSGFGSEDDNDRLAGISQQRMLAGEGEFQSHVELWDIWLPLQGLLVTLSMDQDIKPLQVMEWSGHETGPFKRLVFEEVPGQVMPLPPVALWRDLHNLGNNIWRKLDQQARRQKTVTIYRGSAEEDAERIRDAGDGSMIASDDPAATREARFGGPDPQLLGMTLQIRDLFSYLSGNLDALGGLGPQAETLGQDQLLTVSAGQRITDMQEQTVAFVEDIIFSLSLDLWTDPLVDIPIVKRVGNFDIGVPTKFTPESREGDFLQYNFNVDPYSMRNQTPETKLQGILTMVERLILPLTPQMEAQGLTVDMKALMEIVGRYSNLHELNEILTENGVPMQQEGSPTQPPQGNPNTTRRYERINRPGTTRQGKDKAMAAMFSGQNLQPDEAAAGVRGVG